MDSSGQRTWDLFCRLIDNFGDVGVSWRLAADLASRGEQVRLWIDDDSPLRFMAPHGAPGVEVRPWPADDDRLGGLEPGDAVIETFGCQLPSGFLQNMLQRRRPPVWINLEYLGVEDFARRSHGLPSPQANGLPKWFFFPGFAPGTGGLLREPHLMPARATFDRDRWLENLGIQRRPEERVVLLFCYEAPCLGALLKALAAQPTLVLLAQGPAQQQVPKLLATGLAVLGRLRTHALPWLTQSEFDHAMWSADLNCVRGEDTVVRALWAGSAMLWQLYPQEAAVRELKLRAWLRHFFPDAAGYEPDEPLYRDWLDVHRRYNGLDGPAPEDDLILPDWATWRQKVLDLRSRMLLLPDLCTQLRDFVTSKS